MPISNGAPTSANNSSLQRCLSYKTRAGRARSVVVNQRRRAGRFHLADISKMVAIAVRGETLGTGADNVLIHHLLDEFALRNTSWLQTRDRSRLAVECRISAKTAPRRGWEPVTGAISRKSQVGLTILRPSNCHPRKLFQASRRIFSAVGRRRRIPLPELKPPSLDARGGPASMCPEGAGTGRAAQWRVQSFQKPRGDLNGRAHPLFPCSKNSSQLCRGSRRSDAA